MIDAAYPQNMSQPIRKKFKAIGKQSIKLVVDFVPDIKEKCLGFKDLTTGRWIRAEKENGQNLRYKHKDILWEWNSARCKSVLSLESCKRSVYMIGDSFMIGWKNMFPENYKLKRINGLYSKDEERHLKFWKRQPTSCQILHEINQEIQSFQPDIVFWNSGHWDLRDLSKEEYISDFKKALESCAPNHSHWIWRTNAPFSLEHKSGGIYVRDYRSNEKIEFSNIAIKRYLSWKHVDYYDSWNIFAPFWDEPCDTHHYLCSTYSDSALGWTDLALFNGYVCLL
jgi:hypothetical protein